jgi:hypothetical protein
MYGGTLLSYLVVIGGIAMEQALDAEPKIIVEQESEFSGEASHEWIVGWRIYNRGMQSIQIHTAHLPHGRFRSTKKGFHPPLEIEPNHSVNLELPASCKAQEGSPIENAFIILATKWNDEDWLILVRLQIQFERNRIPKGRTEFITTHKVGFSKTIG